MTFISTSGSSKVLRWKLALQHLQFNVEHIKGEDNLVADVLSRLPDNIDDKNMNNKNSEDALLCLFDYDAPIPNNYYKIISSVHNSRVGHFGISMTLLKLKDLLKSMQTFEDNQLTIPREFVDKLKWPYMRNHVTKFIRDCPYCQKQSAIKPKITTEPYNTNSWYPMDLLSIDSIGPLEESTDGYTYILVIIDCFTRFVELFAIKSTTAKEAAQCLLQHFGRYGLPTRLRSDNGTQFANEIIREFTHLLDIEHELITPYSHEENSIVERANKEILRHLKAFLFDNNIMHNDWVLYLPIIQRIINSTPHESIGMSPATLLFGDNIQLDRGIFLPSSFDTNNHEVQYDSPQEGLNSWIEQMLKRQKEVISVAQKVQQEILKERHLHNNKDKSPMKPTDKNMVASSEEDGQQHQPQADDNNIEEITRYPINSLVLHRNLNNRSTGKLDLPWKGPFRIVAINEKNSRYTIQNIINQRTKTVHISTLKLFNEGSSDPVLVASKDRQQDIVEQVLDIIPPRTGTAMMNYKFRIKWLGYDDPKDITIEPYNNVKNNIVVHNYLRNNNLHRLIPTAFR